MSRSLTRRVGWGLSLVRELRQAAMKGMVSRARSSVQKEREPFNSGPYRPKIASPGRKSRGNGENVPPDGPLNVQHLPLKIPSHFCSKFNFGIGSNSLWLTFR